MSITFLLLLCLPFTLCVGSTTVSPSDPNIHYSGRLTSSYEFEWSGIQITTGFTGTSIQVLLKDNGNMYNVFVDGVFVYWLNASTSTQTYSVASGLKPGNHVILVTKRTEAFFGTAQFLGFVLDSGAKTLPVTIPSRKIEFIGDSITCGYGDLGHYPCSFSAETEDNYYSYGPVTARALDAELHLEAWSGMGMVRNYGDKNTTSAVPFPALFPYILPNAKQGEWNFSSWVPEVVVINLGTNDYSTQPYPPEDIYVNAYINFVNLYSKLYQPTPKFFLVCGPMENSQFCPYAESVATTTKATYVNLEGILTYPTDYGCDYHPAVSGHAKMANIVIPTIKKVMGW